LLNAALSLDEASNPMGKPFSRPGSMKWENSDLGDVLDVQNEIISSDTMSLMCSGKSRPGSSFLDASLFSC